MADKSSARSRFEQGIGQAHQILETARECAALTDPTVLPPLGHTEDEPLPEAYQSIGSYAVLSMVGRMLQELYPPGFPWFQLNLKPEVQYDSGLDPAEINSINRLLMLMELQVQATLESSGIRSGDNSAPAGFLSQKAKSLRQLIVTGDTLERLDDDFRLRVYRRDQYITKRDSRGDVLYHVTCESIDPKALTPEQFNASGLKPEILDMDPDHRMQKLYTTIDWNPREKVWEIEQSIDDNVIHSQVEKVSPYFATPWKLSPDEDYGRGHVELHIGNLRTLNTLEKRRLDILGIISKVTPMIDHGSPTHERDLCQETGVPVRARVRGGKVEDVAFLGFPNISEHQSLISGIEMKTRELGQAFLVESANTRDAERVTAFERRRVAIELNSAVGGVYPSIADHQHLPMLRRSIHNLRKQKRLPHKDLDDRYYDIVSLTGLAAIVRDQKATQLLELAQVAQALGPEALSSINMGVLSDAWLRYRSIYEPGLIKTPEERQAEQQAQIQAQTQLAAGQSAADAAGKIAVEAAKAGA